MTYDSRLGRVIEGSLISVPHCNMSIGCAKQVVVVVMSDRTLKLAADAPPFTFHDPSCWDHAVAKAQDPRYRFRGLSKAEAVFFLPKPPKPVRLAIATEHSLYAAIRDSNGEVYIGGRVTFEAYDSLPVGRYSGRVTTGQLNVGSVFSFDDPDFGRVNTTPIVSITEV